MLATGTFLTHYDDFLTHPFAIHRFGHGSLLRARVAIQRCVRHCFCRMASPLVNDPLTQLRPDTVLDTGATNGVGQDDLSEAHVKLEGAKKKADTAKEATPVVPYYKLFR